MFRAILLFLAVVLLVRAVMRFLGGVIQGASSNAAASGRRPTAPAMKMVRDPVCGTYVVPGKALELARGRETVYFCSDKCRDQWSNAH